MSRISPFLYQFEMTVRAPSNERSVGKVKIHCVQVQLWDCCQSDPDEIKSSTEETFAQCHIWSLRNRCFFRTALNYFCHVLSPSDTRHLNMKSHTHFNIFLCKSLGKKFCVITMTDRKQSQNHLDWERPLRSLCPTMNKHCTGWPMDFHPSMKYISSVHFIPDIVEALFYMSICLADNPTGFWLVV